VSSRVLGRRKLVMKSADIARVYLRGESRMTPVVVEGSELSGLKAVTQTQYALSIHLYMFLVTSELWLLFRRLCPLLGSRTQAFYSLGFEAWGFRFGHYKARNVLDLYYSTFSVSGSGFRTLILDFGFQGFRFRVTGFGFFEFGFGFWIWDSEILVLGFGFWVL
jgi:hypothetical protein